jgi:hypothetical protein
VGAKAIRDESRANGATDLPPLPFTRIPEWPARPALPYRSELDILQVCLPGTLQDFRFRFFAVWPSAEQYTPKKE